MESYKTVGITILILFGLSIIASMFIIISGKTTAKTTTETAYQELPFTGMTFSQKNTIAVLNIFSMITYVDDSGAFFYSDGVINWIEYLRLVEESPNVKAVILRINSPGGTIAATQELYNEINRVREAGKKVIVSVGDMAASGAYYISCAADYIVANPGSLLGSIGVIMYSLEFSDLMNDLGITYNVIKSGDNKDMFSMFKEMTAEEKSLLQEAVMDSYEQFIDAVLEGREIDEDELREVADGRIMTANQALELNMIDELGDYYQTIDIAADMCGIVGEPNVVELGPSMLDFWSYLGYSANRFLESKTDIDLIDADIAGIPESSFSPMMYLYPY